MYAFNQILPFTTFFSLIGIFTILFILKRGIFIVGGEQIAIIERRWIGKSMPQDRVVAMANEVGVQARILRALVYMF